MTKTDTQDETSALLSYLIKPVKDLENDFHEAMESTDNKFQRLDTEVRKTRDENKNLYKMLDDVKVSPNKLEQRISKLEGQVQHIDTIRTELRDLSESAYDAQNQIMDLRLDSKRTGEKFDKGYGELIATKGKLTDAERAIMRMTADCEAHAANIKDLQSAYEIMARDLTESEKRVTRMVDNKCQNAKEVAEDAIGGVRDLNRRSDQFEKAVQRSLDDKINASSTQVSSKIDGIFGTLQSVEEKISSLLKAVDLMEGRIYRMEKTVETCEKRCDNFGSQIREIKAEIGG